MIETEKCMSEFINWARLSAVLAVTVLISLYAVLNTDVLGRIFTVLFVINLLVFLLSMMKLITIYY